MQQASSTAARARPEHRSEGQLQPAVAPRIKKVRYTGLIGGLLLAALTILVLPADLNTAARLTAGVVVLMGTWWMTEAVPIPVTALLPLVLFPAMGIAGIDDVANSYANDTLFLFLGGFMIALGMQKWNLHRRIALRIVLLVGTRPTRLIAGLMIATALLGMWVSNTATAMMMIPLGMSVVALVEAQPGVKNNSRFGVGLMLGIAYSATLSAFGTIVASPGNVFVVAYIEENFGYRITFLQWMMFGLPLAAVFMVLGWFVITKVLWKPELDEIPGGRQLIADELRSLGKMSAGELLVLVIFLATALSWIFVPVIFEDPWATDPVIAMIAGILVFMIPARPGDGVMLMDWETANKTPWGTMILVGGGLALSVQIMSSGLSEWIGESLTVLGGLPVWFLIPAVVLLMLILTEFTSSMASITAFVPLVAGIAVSLGQDPVVIAIMVTQACQSAFMLPVASIPNAIAYGTGSVNIQQMVRTGLVFNLMGLVLVSAVGLFLLPNILV